MLLTSEVAAHLQRRNSETSFFCASKIEYDGLTHACCSAYGNASVVECGRMRQSNRLGKSKRGSHEGSSNKTSYLKDSKGLL